VTRGSGVVTLTGSAQIPDLDTLTVRVYMSPTMATYTKAGYDCYQPILTKDVASYSITR
jgi:hypothetical protein